MKIALGQINPTIGDFEYNTSLMVHDMKKARELGCSLVVFPELSIVGYPPKDLVEKPAFITDNMAAVEEFSRTVQDIYVLCGFVERAQKGAEDVLYNAVALLGEGRVISVGRKRLLPTYDVFDEARYFESARESLVFDLEGITFGVTLCEDIWKVGDLEGVPKYDINPVADLIQKDIDVLINLSASPYSLNKPKIRMQILKRIAGSYRLPVLYCNQMGGNDDLIFDGSSMVVDQNASLVMAAPEFETSLLVWDSERECREIPDPWLDPEDALLKGLTMGTADYARKCGFQKALVGLSGGIDSALVGVIATRALGRENVIGVSMPSQYTSQMSKEDSRFLAQNLGIRFEEIPISDIYRSFKKALAAVFHGMEEDTTEENIQARVRGTLLMGLSNKFNALLLATGNKSEMAMGYCTLYGDMNGGLAVIADVPKTLCYRIARRINANRIVIPERIIKRPPSAELKPDQTDQDILPPYDLLDEILLAAVEKNLSPAHLETEGYDPEVLEDVFHRLNINEYKRRQAPPGLKVTTKAFGYGRRYPIAKGGKDY